jgi:hypothetical protein
MKARSVKGQSIPELQEALQQTIRDGFKSTLAIVFVSVKFDLDQLCKVFDSESISVFGATSNGDFIEPDFVKESISVLLLDLNPDYFMILFAEYPEKNYREITRGLAQRSLERFSVPAFLIAGSHIETDAEELLFGFEDIVGRQVNLYGGMAGDDMSFTGQYVFTNKQSSSRGIVTLVLDESKIKIKGIATCGWKPMGTKRTVTKSEGNRLYTIDDVPVLELTKKFSGLENIDKDDKWLAMEIATNFPIQLQREKGAPVMRPGLAVNWEDGSFICSGSIPVGSMVRFSLPPDFDVIDEVVNGIKRLKEKEMPEADAVIIFSCAGRLLSLGPLMSKEIEGVKNVWDVPMTGMFSNAELARATDGNLEMHNLTTCCVALKEK